MLTDDQRRLLAVKRYLIMDRDTKFSDAFRKILEDQRVESVRLPPRSPNLTPNVERFMKSLKGERRRLNEELMKLNGGASIPLSPEQRRLLAEKAMETTMPARNAPSIPFPKFDAGGLFAARAGCGYDGNSLQPKCLAATCLR